MSDEHAPNERQSPWSRFNRAERRAPDERDDTIARLEHDLAQERENAAASSKTAEDLRFQMQVLERSYAKQLADAREQSADMERELADQKAAFAVLDQECQEALQLLTQARAELERLTAPRNGPPRPPQPRDAHGPEPAAVPRRFAPLQSEGTINELIADASWAEARRASAEEEAATGAEAPLDVEPPNDMIAPDLVFGEDDERDETPPGGAREA